MWTMAETEQKYILVADDHGDKCCNIYNCMDKTGVKKIDSAM